MTQKSIEELTFEKMREILSGGDSMPNDAIFLGDDFALLSGEPSHFNAKARNYFPRLD